MHLAPEATMPVSSSDILNLSHALKDVCEVNCETSPCLTNTLRTLSQINLIRAQLEYGRQLDKIAETCHELSYEDNSGTSEE